MVSELGVSIKSQAGPDNQRQEPDNQGTIIYDIVKNRQTTDQSNGTSVSASTDYKYRVGYWWSEKKSQKFNANELGPLFAERQCEFVKLDFDRHLDQQGPFDVIVHKLSDILVKADQGDVIAKKTINAFESYVRKHPKIVVLDPLDNNKALLDRYKQYRLIEQCELAKENVVFTPTFVHLTSTNIDVNRGRIRRSRITFPIVCKPILAQGSTGAHQMSIIFNEAGLKDVKPPCVAQSFVNHNARLFKLFVIKDKYYIMERPSLKNFHNVSGDQETVFFYSHDISKPNSSSSLTELDDIDKQKLEKLMVRWQNGLKLDQASKTKDLVYDDDDELNRVSENVEAERETIGYKTSGENNIINESNNNYDISRLSSTTIQKTQSDTPQNNARTNSPSSNVNSNNVIAMKQRLSPLVPCDEILSKIVKIFNEKLGLTFYGIDLIIENDTSRYAIIDMNTFPGYDGVENFLAIFRDIVCDAIPSEAESLHEDGSQQSIMKLPNKKKPAENDSGIEST